MIQLNIIPIVGLKGHNTQNRIDGPYVMCHMCLDVILMLVVLKGSDETSFGF